jgi:hypothetical protein
MKILRALDTGDVATARHLREAARSGPSEE